MSARLPERRRRPWRWFALAMLLIAVGGGSAFAIREGLRTCGALDVLLERSGCRGTVTIDGFQPMLFETLAVSSKSGKVVLFGDAGTPDGWRAGFAEIDLDPLAERRRGPLPMLTGAPNTMRISPDGRRVILYCDFRGPCVEGGVSALDAPVDALEDAAPITGPEADRYRREPPGVPNFVWKAPFGSLVMPDRETVAAIESDGESRVRSRMNELVLRRLADGSEIRRIRIDPAPNISFLDRPLAASRSGRMVMLVTASNPPRVGTQIYLFDVAAGRQIGVVSTDPGFNAKPVGAFTPDETGVILARRIGQTATEVSVFDLPGKVRPE